MIVPIQLKISYAFLVKSRHARELQLVAEAEGAKVSLVAVDGKPVEHPKVIVHEVAGEEKTHTLRPSTNHRVFLNYAGAADSGLEVTLEIEASTPRNAVAPVHIKLVDYSDGYRRSPTNRSARAPTESRCSTSPT